MRTSGFWLLAWDQPRQRKLTRTDKPRTGRYRSRVKEPDEMRAAGRKAYCPFFFVVHQPRQHHSTVERGAGLKGAIRGQAVWPANRTVRPTPKTRRMPRDAEASVLFSVCYMALRQVLQLLVRRIRSDDFKELEILVLRHELAILRRRTFRPIVRPIDRLF
jgi:hypothetical protein